MKPLSHFLVLLLAATLVPAAWAKRVGPKPVAPVIHQGIEYVTPHDNGREGRIEARSEKTGEKLWEAVIYKVKIDPNLEEDVQWVFITAIKLRGDRLEVTNEKNEKYLLDLKTRKVEREKTETK